MDLANFESTDITIPTPSDIASSNTTAEDVLKYIDSSKWYTSFSRRGRWMDLMGDYAGTEPFIIEGSLVLLILFSSIQYLYRGITFGKRSFRSFVKDNS